MREREIKNEDDNPPNNQNFLIVKRRSRGRKGVGKKDEKREETEKEEIKQKQKEEKEKNLELQEKTEQKKQIAFLESASDA